MAGKKDTQNVGNQDLDKQQQGGRVDMDREVDSTSSDQKSDRDTGNLRNRTDERDRSRDQGNIASDQRDMNKSSDIR